VISKSSMQAAKRNGQGKSRPEGLTLARIGGKKTANQLMNDE
jgi:hypothetical protein